MLILIISIILFILGIIGLYKGFDDWLEIIGIFGSVFGGLLLVAVIVFLINKPYKYRTFKIEYETIKQMTTSKSDIRDATFTNRLIEVNKEINYCREFKDSIWIGIFQNKKICEMKLLNKE